MRRYLQPNSSKMKFKFRPGVYAILPNRGRLLLTFQGGRHQEFQLPGGGVDPGESPLQALHREIMEETGWRIDQPRFLTAYRRFVFMPEYDMWAEKLCKIYLAKPIRRIGPPLEADHEARWLSLPEAILELTNDIDRGILCGLSASKVDQYP